LPNDLEPILLDVAQTAKVLSIGKDAVYELINRDEIPHVRLGERTIRIPAHLLRAWIESRSRGGRL
jgi:excisionase family DNA binding protein